jgi:hypothetical protein
MATMAYLYQRRGGQIEIRESRSTPRGPRSRTLASFRGPLTEAQLDRAEVAASARFDRRALIEKARTLGIRCIPDRADAAARELMAGLRRGAPLDPILTTVLRQQLDAVARTPVPDDLVDVIEWIGASEVVRARALRDVLRLYDTIARSRDPVPMQPPALLPRIPAGARWRAAS